MSASVYRLSHAVPPTPSGSFCTVYSHSVSLSLLGLKRIPGFSKRTKKCILVAFPSPLNFVSVPPQVGEWEGRGLGNGNILKTTKVTVVTVCFIKTHQIKTTEQNEVMSVPEEFLQNITERVFAVYSVCGVVTVLQQTQYSTPCVIGYC